MTTHEVSSVLARIDGLNIHQLPQYQQSVEENNINGMVLSTCELDELGKVLSMKFGDWQLFKTVILSLREAEEIELQTNQVTEEELDIAENSRRVRTNSVMSTKSIHFQEPENSGSSLSTVESEGSRSRGTFGRQGSVDTQRLDSNEISTVFDTIEEDPETPPKNKLLRNDSVVAELMYESGLLRQAMQSFAEDEVNEEEEHEQMERPSSKMRGLPVQFSLSSHNDTIPDWNDENRSQNSEDHYHSEYDPLIAKEKTEGSITGSPRPILKKPKNLQTRTGSQQSINNIQFVTDMDICGSEPDLTVKRKTKSPDFIHADKSLSLSSTGFPILRDKRKSSLLSSGTGYSVDSIEVISEVHREPGSATVRATSPEKTSPQRMHSLSIEDSIKQFTMSRATSLNGSEKSQQFDDYSSPTKFSSSGSFGSVGERLDNLEESYIPTDNGGKSGNSESFV